MGSMQLGDPRGLRTHLLSRQSPAGGNQRHRPMQTCTPSPEAGAARRRRAQRSEPAARTRKAAFIRDRAPGLADDTPFERRGRMSPWGQERFTGLPTRGHGNFQSISAKERLDTPVTAPILRGWMQGSQKHSSTLLEASASCFLNYFPPCIF